MTLCSLVADWSLTQGREYQSLISEIAYLSYLIANDYLMYLLFMAGASDIHQGGGDVLCAGAARNQAQGRGVGVF